MNMPQHVRRLPLYMIRLFRESAFADPGGIDRSTHVYHQYTLVTKDIDRDKLLEHLQAKNIPCAIYYPVPLHMQKAYLDPRYSEGDLPVTEELSRTVISLPMHTELDEEQIAFIAANIIEFFNK